LDAPARGITAAAMQQHVARPAHVLPKRHTAGDQSGRALLRISHNLLAGKRLGKLLVFAVWRVSRWHRLCNLLGCNRPSLVPAFCWPKRLRRERPLRPIQQEPHPMTRYPACPDEPARAAGGQSFQWKLLVLPGVCVALLAAVYAVVKHDTWEASQALVIRNEAVSSDSSPGSFRQPEDMKTVQETILELARSRSVLEAALRQVGPPADYKGKHPWPSAEDVADFREQVKLAPPKGAEFGKTEIFYLKVRDKDRSRAVALCNAVCDQVQAHFQQLRDEKARSMIRELERSVELARRDLEQSTARLAAIETEVGSDLGELRALDDGTADDSALQQTVAEIQAELRRIAARRNSQEQLLVLLRAAQNDAGRLLAAPKDLLDSQPALRQLKEGLLAAQIHTAQLLGKMSEEHPEVRAAREAEEEIARHLHNELAIAIRGLEAEREMSRQREALLSAQLAETNQRLARLARVRARYSNQVAENAHYRGLLERTEQTLADARAKQAAARSATLISRMDRPDAGHRPVGPTRAMIVLGGIAGGVMLSLGLWVLQLPVPFGLAARGQVHAEGNGRFQADTPSAERTPGVPALGPVSPAISAHPISEPQAVAQRLSLRQALERISAIDRA